MKKGTIAKVLVLLMLIQVWSLWEFTQIHKWSTEIFFKNLCCITSPLNLNEARASESTIFGPKKYIRTTGKSNVCQDTFAATEGRAQLIIINGEKNGQHRVSSAIITFNGIQLFGPRHFNQNVYRLEKTIDLSQMNTLKVELRSIPKSYLHIEIRKAITNQPPVANAGQDQNVTVGSLVTLDGRNSFDPDNDPITYRWVMTPPSGSNASLSNSTSVMPTFTPDVSGEYRISLIVNDGQADSAPDEVIIIATMPNVAPTAYAGPDQSVVTGSTVLLDGTGSFDPDGDPLTYQWQILSSPAGSAASLNDPSSATPTFLADMVGQYIILLTVNDGELDSLPDDVIIISAIPNAPPVSYAGDDQIVSKNATIHLDGQGSSDPNNDSLTYSWSIVSKPAESASELNDPASPTPQILADRVGEYVFRLVVFDGELYSDPDTVVVRVVNDSPIADAGVDQDGIAGVMITLNGSGSSDLNGDPLTYQWSIVSAPGGSNAVIVNPTAVNPTITPDVPGIYVIQLVVNDGSINSSPDTITLTVRVTVPNVVGQSQASAEAAIVAAGLTVGTITQAYSGAVPSGSVISQNPSGGTLTLAGSSVSLTISLGPTPVLVPNVVGMTQSAAETAILSAGLQVGTVTTANSLTVPAGSVISQDPVPGTSVPAGAFVSLVVLLGPSLITVPDVVGMTQANAQSAITGAGLAVGTITTANSDTVQAGIVISQNPAPGASVAPCSAVDLILSLGPSGLPPDPVVVAPPVDPTVATTMSSATSFLYTGDNPIQTGVAPGTIESRRVAVLRGKVMDRSENPLPGVTITILNHPELGQTLTRADGIFDMAVNGGGYLTVNYQKAGYLPAQRQINVPWQDYAWLPDVILIQLDNQVTVIDLTLSEPIQVARGSVVTDEDGTRQATLLIPQGTQAQMFLPDGSTQPLTTLSIRATEYTVGPNGPKAMPAELPPNVGYTYAVELSVDEALTNGRKVNGKDVVFNQPVVFYVDNFLNFPTGGIVPVGYYDNDKGAWIPYDNGRIIAIVGITGGLADVDVNGDGSADTGTALSNLGINDQERQRLASLYTPPKSLWRVLIGHLSTWDHNWTYGPPPGATNTSGDPTPERCEDNPCHNHGSIIVCQNQTLGEQINITGTPFTLNYRSDRVPGRRSLYSVTIPLSKETVHPDLRGIELDISVAGRRRIEHFPPTPNQTYHFTWDGTDSYGRQVQGSQPISISIGYVYRAYYYEPAEISRAFAAFSVRGTYLTLNEARQQVTLWKNWKVEIGLFGFRAKGLGGWSIDVNHTYDPVGKTLYLGDGSTRGAVSLGHIVTTVAGTGLTGYSGDGDLATEARLWQPGGVEVGPDGSIYIADSGNHRIRRIDPDGIITTVAGSGIGGGYSGDGGLATAAQLRSPEGVAIGPDGSIYIADYGNYRIRRVGLDGIITTVAGTGVGGYSGDGGPAISARMGSPRSVAAAPDGSIYIADYGNYRIRRVGSDGVITTVAGTGVRGYSGDGGPATEAQIFPASVTIGQDGSIYISGGERVRRIGQDGIITTVAGGGTGSDGDLATEAALSGLTDVAVGRNGSIYIAENQHHRIRRITSDGIITTVAGSGIRGYSGDGGPATAANIDYPDSVAIGPDGSIYISVNGDRIRRIIPSSIYTAFITEVNFIPSEDGQEIFTFDDAGRHLRTLHALTNAVLYEFTYDSNGLLTGIRDGDGNLTSITRDAGGDLTAIVAPRGQTTTLLVNEDGYLQSITNPAGETISMTYGNGGLLTMFTNPRGNSSQFAYDDLGRLIRVEDPEGGGKTLARTEDDTGFTVTLTTALGRVTTYRTEFLSTGDKRSVIIEPNGSQSQILSETNGRTTFTQPNGTVVTVRNGPDPRFGMLAPVTTSLTLRTPGGLSLTYNGSLTAELNDPANLLSLRTLTATQTINGRTTTSVYNAATRTVTTTSHAGRQSVTTLDEKGRITGSQFGGLAPLGVTYDAFGRPDRLTLGTGGRVLSVLLGYDSATGYVSSLTDPMGDVWSFLRDAAGRTTSLIRPDLEQIGTVYDSNSNVVSITPPGAAPHRFTYNPRNELATYTPPDVDGVTMPVGYSYTADTELEVITQADSGMINFNYNPTSGYLSSIAWPRASGSTTFTYEAATGMLASMTAPDGESLAFGYDGFLPRQFVWSGTVNGTVNLGFNADLRVSNIRVQVGADQRSWTYVYGNADGLLTQAGDLTMTRDPVNGLLTGTTLGSVTTLQSHTGYDELALLSARFGSTMLYEAEFLEHDALGRVLRVRETVEGNTQTQRYVYDGAGRLSQVWIDGSLHVNYDYDANGNRIRTEYPLSGLVITATYDPQNRLRTWGDVSYEFDTNGFLSRRTGPGGTTTYNYNSQGALRSIGLPGGQTITYAIDPSGRRIGKSVNGTFERGWLYLDSLNPVAEVDYAGNLRAIFVYGSHPFVPDYMVVGGATYRLISDMRGSVRLVVNVATGAAVQRLDYDSWGRVLTDTNPGFQPFGYAGGLYDSATGLVRFGARDYDPEVGRWLARDPILFEGSQSNLYAYVNDDPINGIDPSGQLAAFAVIWGGMEFGLTIADITSCIDTFFDPCADTLDKIGCTALTAAGIVLPAGGLAMAARAARTANNARRTSTVLREATHAPSWWERFWNWVLRRGRPQAPARDEIQELAQQEINRHFIPGTGTDLLNAQTANPGRIRGPRSGPGGRWE